MATNQTDDLDETPDLYTPPSAAELPDMEATVGNAMDLVLELLTGEREYYDLSYAGGYEMPASSPGGRTPNTYEIDLHRGTCNCPAFQKWNQGDNSWCKHLLAIAIVESEIPV